MERVPKLNQTLQGHGQPTVSVAQTVSPAQRMPLSASARRYQRPTETKAHDLARKSLLVAQLHIRQNGVAVPNERTEADRVTALRKACKSCKAAPFFKPTWHYLRSCGA
jgi:hypothetical protein